MNTDNHYLVLDPNISNENTYLQNHFCGRVVESVPDVDNNAHVYLTGDISAHVGLLGRKNTYIIKELSHNVPSGGNLVTLGEVPINVHGVGVYFRGLFKSDKDYFDQLCEAHDMQMLTESNKPKGGSLRKGIYLSRVENINGDYHFNLLRCSTNLSGPTDNFRAIDEEIIAKVQSVSQPFFPNAAPFNHVLAQVYENKTSDEGAKERKGTIKAHSDKTKDMPPNALMAFTTFYKFHTFKGCTHHGFDTRYRDCSVLTRLHFKLKKCVHHDPTLIKEFSLTLYPNSVFVIPMLTNRLYTHEIKPSTLPIDRIPTRLGYVIRCSKTKAVHKNGRTHIETSNGELVPMREIMDADMEHIKRLYFDENVTDQEIDYGDILVSMNEGDYMQPML